MTIGAHARMIRRRRGLSLDMLHLASAQLASREGRSGDADNHLALAAELANATGECNDLNCHFGSANVAAWCGSWTACVTASVSAVHGL